MTARLLRTWKPEGNILLYGPENWLRILLVGACILLGLLSGVPQSDLGWNYTNGANQLLQGFLWGIAIALFFFLATRWLVTHTGQQFYSSTIILAIIPRSISEATLVILAMIPAVLVEELLFRSLLLGGLGPLAPTWILLLGSAVLFGILHSPQGIWGMVGASLAGGLFGGLFLWQNSLITPTIAHYVANLVQIGIAALIQEEITTQEKY
ncbi:CPBP family intramembrane metalloprotease [Chloroflexi bacterium TSY]|nr:CPBP family intramembrane metalloprotease [Chloroflexi bacterium TSY]